MQVRASVSTARRKNHRGQSESHRIEPVETCERRKRLRACKHCAGGSLTCTRRRLTPSVVGWGIFRGNKAMAGKGETPHTTPSKTGSFHLHSNHPPLSDPTGMDDVVLPSSLFPYHCLSPHSGNRQLQEDCMLQLHLQLQFCSWNLLIFFSCSLSPTHFVQTMHAHNLFHWLVNKANPKATIFCFPSRTTT